MPVLLDSPAQAGQALDGMMNDVFVRHKSPFTQLLNVESRFLIECMHTFIIKDLIQSCSRMRLSYRTVTFFKYKREQLVLYYAE